ncbi:MAG: AzlD domain-containing protein [Oscillospiraceae bacterium]|nr:AzlD domain-containing protein [Oscillospiraceae bacterium]
MSPSLYSALQIAVIAAVTILLRFLPFWLFGGGRKTPKFVSYLGSVLPSAIMGMLVVYCLRNLEFSAASGWLPAVIAGAAVAALQALTRRSLVSILGGTALYMVLVNFL